MSETKEVPVHVLQMLLASHEKVKQAEEQEAEAKTTAAKRKIENIDATSALMNSLGPLLLVFGGIAVMAAPELLALHWVWSYIIGNLVSLGGQMSMAGGAYLTSRTFYNRYAARKRKEQVVLLEESQATHLLPEVTQ
jgi:hypothetical protein